jgi:hypothetical protein
MTEKWRQAGCLSYDSDDRLAGTLAHFGIANAMLSFRAAEAIKHVKDEKARLCIN